MSIACLQETKLGPRSRQPNFPDYAALRLDRRGGGGGGGLVTLIHHSVAYTQLVSPVNDGVCESIVIEASIANTPVKIANVYIPPASSSPPNFVATLAPFLAMGAIVVGDVNGHEEEWSAAQGDARGAALSGEIDAANYVVLNDPAIATRPVSASSPDVALAPSSLALNFDWSVTTTLNSDHLPISLRFPDDSPPARNGRRYTNFRKADWLGFSLAVDALLFVQRPPTTCASGEKVLRRILLMCSSRFIPGGSHRVYVPGIDAASAALIEERDDRRRQDPTDPELTRLNAEISASLASSSRQRWMETVKNADHRSNPVCFWRLLKGLVGKRTYTAPNQPVSFANKPPISKPSSIANGFCKHYVSVGNYQANRASRQIYRGLKVNNPLDRSLSMFSEADVKGAISRSKNSTAAGPNGLTILHLKHLGPVGIRFLTHLFNLSVRGAELPAIWKAAHVVPVLKPGKASDQAASYRPVSLLCPEIKVLERLLLPVLDAALSPAPSQHGFRKNRSTVTALMPVATAVAQGFNRPKPATRTGLLCVDLSKAFDMVEHAALLHKIGSTSLHPNIKRWLVTYLRDRKIRCLFGGSHSRWRKMRVGVPQGSVSSPCLFNFFVNTVNAPSAPLNESYADDFHAAAQDVSPQVIADCLSSAATEISAQSTALRMPLLPAKSTVTLFTPWNKQYGRLPEVRVGNEVIPQENNPKLLGVTFDPFFTFNAHAAITAGKASRRLNVLRAVADTSFGHDKECLLMTFKSLIRPFFDYAAPIVYPNYSPTSIRRLQIIQNKSLRLITGCHHAAAQDHLHDETQVLPVAQHLRLLSAQYLARALQPSHPSHEWVTSTGPQRAMKETLRSRCWEDVEPFVVAGTIPQGELKNTLSQIHTKVVTDSIASLGDNRVLQARPPSVNDSEKLLPRRTRAVLSQLRSGHCSRLSDFQLRIGATDSALCSECNASDATTSHLFECPSHPTNLTTKDLWEKPWDVADFLSGIQAFSDLPDPGPPPPPPPPLVRHGARPPPEPPPSPSPSSSSDDFSTLLLDSSQE